jgi:hypothetical protein
MNRGLSVRAADVYDHGIPSDRVIGLPVLTQDGHIVEASLFTGIMRPKHILVISSQIGCLSRCVFCELGQSKPVRNLTPEEMRDQVTLLANEAHERHIPVLLEPTKITIANSGEPLHNPELIKALKLLAQFGTSFKISTIFPRGRHARNQFEKLARFASTHKHPVQLQISLISTDESFRKIAAGIQLATFDEILSAGMLWKTANPNGRRVNLSLIMTEQTPCDPDVIAQWFPPELFRIRLRSYVPTERGRHKKLAPKTQNATDQIKARLRTLGYNNLDWAMPSPTEKRYALASNTFLRRFATAKQT